MRITSPTVTPRTVVGATLTVVAVVGAVWLGITLLGVLIAAFVALLLAAALKPLALRLEQRLGSRTTAAAVLHGGLVVIVVGFGGLALPMILDQIGAFAAAIPELYASLRGKMLATDSATLHRLAAALPAKLDPGTAATLDAGAMISWAQQAVQIVFTTIGVLALSF